MTWKNSKGKLSKNTEEFAFSIIILINLVAFTRCLDWARFLVEKESDQSVTYIINVNSTADQTCYAIHLSYTVMILQR